MESSRLPTEAELEVLLSWRPVQVWTGHPASGSNHALGSVEMRNDGHLPLT